MFYEKSFPLDPSFSHSVQFRDSTNLWTICSHADVQLTSPRTHFTILAKCLASVEWTQHLLLHNGFPLKPPKTDNDQVSQSMALVNVWLALFAPSSFSLLSSRPIWQSENSNKNTNKNLPQAQARTAKPDILISFKSNCSKWLVELGHFPLLPLNWKYNYGGQ